MERLTKLAIVAWTCAVLVLQIELLSSSWHELPRLALVLSIVMLALGALSPRWIVVVLAASYVFPILIQAVHPSPAYAPNDSVWIAALVAIMLPDLVRTPWRIPARWRLPLVTAALVVMATAPIVVLREIDLNPGLLFNRGEWNWAAGAWPALRVKWILHVSLTLVVGILWFDWLFGARALSFTRAIVTPLVASVSVLAAVCLFQLFVDVSFWNPTIYATLGRASGTLNDANVSGMVAAMWIGGAYLWAGAWPRYRLAIASIAMVVLWLAVWATGSRTAFLAAFMASVFIVAATSREPGRSRAPLFKLAATAIVLGVIVSIGAAFSPVDRGPLGRFRRQMSDGASIAGFARDLWSRNGYGTAADAIIGDLPLVGIGVGSFNTLGRDYSNRPLWQADNAQNWIRHQLAEFGVLGAAGWLVWFVMFGLFVLRIRPTDTADTWVTRGVLIGFAAISMLGMPGQHIMVVMTFWTIAFWHVLSVEGRRELEPPLPAWTWAIAVVVAIAAAAGTAQLAMTRLRAPVSAQLHGRSYGYGFSNPEPDSGFRVAQSRAVAVIDAPHEWLSLRVRIDPRVQAPVDVQVWADGRTVLKGRLTGDTPLDTVVRVPVEPHRILIEAAGQRADSPVPAFAPRLESLYSVKWEFLERHP